MQNNVTEIKLYQADKALTDYRKLLSEKEIIISIGWKIDMIVGMLYVNDMKFEVINTFGASKIILKG
jgi:hypothetical protein